MVGRYIFSQPCLQLVKSCGYRTITFYESTANTTFVINQSQQTRLWKNLLIGLLKYTHRKFVIFRNQNEQPKNVKPVLILVTRPEIWECKSPFTIYSWMRARLGPSLQYPTRIVKFLWWTLIRGSTCNIKSQFIFIYLNDLKNMAQVVVTCLRQKLLIPFNCWLGDHIYSHRISFYETKINFAKPTLTKKFLKVVRNHLDIGVGKLSILWF